MFSLLLVMRTKSVNGIRSDFGEMYLDKPCPMENCQELDSLPHLLACRELQGEVQGVLMSSTVICTPWTWSAGGGDGALQPAAGCQGEAPASYHWTETPVFQLQPAAGSLN